MIKEKIIAPDMQTGLRMVKARFGEEALILDSRVRRNRRKGSLMMSEEVEITIGLDQGRSSPEQLRGLGGDGLAHEGPRPLADEIARLERVVDEVEHRIEELDYVESVAGVYPLAAELTAAGVRPDILDEVRADHAEEVPPVRQGDPAAALERLERRIPCVERMALGDLRGHHAFVGAPGVGKSTLAMKLAREAAAKGARAALVAYRPEHPGEQVRLEEAARLHGFEAALAPDRDALLGAVRYLVGRDLVLLDLPGFREDHPALLDEVESILKGDPLLRHFAVQAAGGWLGLPAALAHCDFVALCKTDLADPLPAALNLLDEGERSLTFLSAGGAIESELALATPRRVTAALRSRCLKADAAGAGGRG